MTDDVIVNRLASLLASARGSRGRCDIVCPPPPPPVHLFSLTCLACSDARAMYGIAVDEQGNAYE